MSRDVYSVKVVRFKAIDNVLVVCRSIGVLVCPTSVTGKNYDKKAINGRTRLLHTGGCRLKYASLVGIMPDVFCENFEVGRAEPFVVFVQ